MNPTLKSDERRDYLLAYLQYAREDACALDDTLGLLVDSAIHRLKTLADKPESRSYPAYLAAGSHMHACPPPEHPLHPG
ncbi:hypothetical protein ACT6QH_13675 [Xanthobacter sp. TB0139]|uniref:hypothetical protein n=1 Tax=Xanthobacter sp. TB0139 TaxID=3459178 RepID=UPI0040392FF8